MSFDLGKYNFSAGDAGAIIPDFRNLSEGDRKRLLMAGIEVDENGRGASFLHVDHSAAQCRNTLPGVDLLGIKDALSHFSDASGYYWNLLKPEKDEFTRAAAENTHGGYFLRVKKGVRVPDPIQACLFIQAEGLGQNVHNVVIVEEGASAHLIAGCATSESTREAAHLGVTEIYLEKNASLTMTMVHNWGGGVSVRPRTAGVMAENASFVSNYILLEKVKDLQSCPVMSLDGEGGVARYNSVIAAPEGSRVDSGNKILLNAPGARGEVVSRVMTTGGTVINPGFIGGYAAPSRGHLECNGLILGSGRIYAIPELDAAVDGAELTHEASVGKIAREELEYLMARGLDEEEAASTIVRGFLNVDIMGLPGELQRAVDSRINTLRGCL